MELRRNELRRGNYNNVQLIGAKKMNKKTLRLLTGTGILAIALSLPLLATADRHLPPPPKQPKVDDRGKQVVNLSIDTLLTGFWYQMQPKKLPIGKVYTKDAIILQNYYIDSSFPGADHIVSEECIEFTEIVPGDPNEYKVKWVHNVKDCEKSFVKPGAYTAVAVPANSNDYRIDDVQFKVPTKHSAPTKHTVYFYVIKRVDNDVTKLPEHIDVFPMPGSGSSAGGSDPGHGRYK